MKEKDLISKSEFYAKISELAKINKINLFPREKAFLLSLFDSNTNKNYEVSQIEQILFDETALQNILRKIKKPKGPFQESKMKKCMSEKFAKVEEKESYKLNKIKNQETESRTKIQNFLLNKNTEFYKIWKKMDFNKDKYVSCNDIKSVLSESYMFNNQNINFILSKLGKIL